MFFRHIKKLPALLASSVLLLAGYDPPTTSLALASTSLLIPSPLSAVPAVPPILASPTLGFAPDAFNFPFVGPWANDSANATAVTTDHLLDSNGPFLAGFDVDHHPPDPETMSLFDIGSFDVEALEIIVPALLAVRGTIRTGSGSIAVSIVVEALKAALYLGGLEYRPGLGTSGEADQVDRMLTGMTLRLAIDAVFGALVVLLGRRGRRRGRRTFKACIGTVACELAALVRAQSIILVLAVVVGTQLRPAYFTLLRDSLLLGCLVPPHVAKDVVAREVAVWARGQCHCILLSIAVAVRPLVWYIFRDGAILGIILYALIDFLLRLSTAAATPPPPPPPARKKKHWYSGKR
ncbi:hypothetical protein C8R43DRAFT_23332 [Mycena crocata]|nr:hypothetical protein C8R43DRAFT_23332 [Mycena crocata]